MTPACLRRVANLPMAGNLQSAIPCHRGVGMIIPAGTKVFSTLRWVPVESPTQTVERSALIITRITPSFDWERCYAPNALTRMTSVNGGCTQPHTVLSLCHHTHRRQRTQPE